MSGTLTLTLRRVQGTHELKVDLESPPDAMAHEHEADHQEALKALRGSNRDWVVTRGGAAKPAPVEALQEEQREPVKQGG